MSNFQTWWARQRLRLLFWFAGLRAEIRCWIYDLKEILARRLRRIVRWLGLK